MGLVWPEEKSPHPLLIHELGEPPIQAHCETGAHISIFISLVKNSCNFLQCKLGHLTESEIIDPNL
jgi:hypothetical protein